MKKIKIMLTAITVVAVVGGALAFSAKKYNTNLYCTDNPKDNCSVLSAGVSTTGQIKVEEDVYCTLTQFRTAPCPSITIYDNQ